MNKEGYELWDRDAAALLGDFDDQAAAVAFLEEMLSSLDALKIQEVLDRMQLVHVSPEATEIVGAGVVGLGKLLAGVDPEHEKPPTLNGGLGDVGELIAGDDELLEGVEVDDPDHDAEVLAMQKSALAFESDGATLFDAFWLLLECSDWKHRRVKHVDGTAVDLERCPRCNARAHATAIAEALAQGQEPPKLRHDWAELLRTVEDWQWDQARAGWKRHRKGEGHTVPREEIERIFQAEARERAVNEKADWVWLEERAHPWRKQLWIKGRKLTVGDITGRLETEHLTTEQLAADMDLPVEAVLEATVWAADPEHAALIAAENEQDTRTLSLYEAYRDDPERKAAAEADTKLTRDGGVI